MPSVVQCKDSRIVRVVVVLRVVVFGFRATSMAHYSVSGRVHPFSRRGPFPDDKKSKTNMKHTSS